MISIKISKEITRDFSLMLVFTSLTLIAQAQAHIKNQHISREDSGITNERPYYLQKVSWWDSGNGFVCKVMVDNQMYLTRYDKHGSYVETLVQKTWSENSDLWRTFQKSEYKRLKVISYWEVWDEGKKGYYLELTDRKNQLSTVWADESLAFTAVPTNK